ncbi:MAG: hypothetical protein D6802_08690 [Ardenticatenia bacterium]|nr:MAG: hypothetical protein D6802_08690 [Ardenticatenia bacterium]
MTGDSSNINFLLEFADITACNAQYIAIAIDNTLVTQGTNTWFPDFGDTQTPFAFEYVIEANTSNTGYWDKDYNFTSAGTSFCDATTNLWEIQMPATALGMTWPASTGDYNFAVAIFCHDGSGGICDVSSVSDAMDVITTTGPNTWDEVSDQHLGYQFTAGFGPTAVTLQTLRAERSPTHSRMLTMAVSGLLALAGGVLLVRTRRRV